MSELPRKGTRLLVGVSQYEVDFVIPRHGIDLHLAIDPFLLYKSHDVEARAMHDRLLTEVNCGIEMIRTGRLAEAAELFTVPEPVEIGLGYGDGSRQGSGIGPMLAQGLVDSIRSSPDLMQRGVRHIEELQLYFVGIGPDRISDLAAGFLKAHLIKYTRQQCDMWGISTTQGVPVRGVYNFDLRRWVDTYEDLPLSPVDCRPMILVPRRLVRTLPFISYDDYMQSEMGAFLRSRVSGEKRSRSVRDKSQVVEINQQDVQRVFDYVRRKERDAAKAQPSIDLVYDADLCEEAERLKSSLAMIPTGAKAANEYHSLVLSILNFVFNPELADGEKEVRTVDGTERRDVVYTNESDRSFWSYARQEHSGILLMFEVKNVDQLDIGHVNQTAAYLGDRLGRLGFIVTRSEPTPTRHKKLFAIYNDSQPRKVILVLSDADLNRLLDIRCEGQDPTSYIQKKYRWFRTSVQ